MTTRLLHGQNRIQLRLLLLATVIGASLISLGWHSVAARGGVANAETASFSVPQAPLPQNTYTDDLTVEHDDTLEGDVVVLSGDVTIEEGGEIIGSLIVASGDIEIDSGGRVEGDVTSLSGDVELSGKILGDLSVLSGDVELHKSGLVEGDVSVLSGDVDQDDDSRIGGKLRLGPKVKFPFLGFLGDEIATEITTEIATGISEGIEAELEAERESAATHLGNRENRVDSAPSFIERIFNFVLRLIGATVGIAVIAGGAGLLARSKPAYVESVRLRLRKAMVANFAIGMLFNMVLGFLTVLFAIIFCLMPMSLVFGGTIIAVNGIGWTAIGATVGRRLTGYTDAAIPSVATVVLGTIAVTAPLALLWATGSGCFSFMALLIAFIVASAGAGAVLAPWLRRLTDSELPAGQLSA